MVITMHEARLVLERVLHGIAPEIDVSSIGPDDQLLEAGHLDSIDFIAMIEALREETGIEVSPRDYPNVATAVGFVNFVVHAAQSDQKNS